MNAIRLLQFFVIANSVVLVIQAVRIIAVYSAIFSLTKGEQRQLPLHVWLIAVSYLLYTGTTGYFLYLTPLPSAYARTILYGLAGLIGQYALFNILSYDRRRLSAASTRMEGEPE